MHQQWEIKDGTGISITPKGVQLQSGKPRFLPPKTWERWYLPWKLEVEGGVTIASCFQRPEVLSGVVVTSGGMVRCEVYNTSDRVIRITPTTPLVSLHGHKSIEVVRLAKAHTAAVDTLAESLRNELARRFPDVSDLSRHPIVPAMEPLRVRADEVCWTPPREQGLRTSYKTEQVADRRKIAEQLEHYVQRGYLRTVSMGERVALSPLYPIPKKDGSYRFTNDFRWLNAHFKKHGMTQVDVWRRLWDVDPAWRYFAKLDLKDGFFAIPVCPELQTAFAFTWQDRRYAWKRLPQGWSWSPILFAERVAEIVQGLGAVQYADDLLVGGVTPEELCDRVRSIFARFQEFGLKVNLAKTELLLTKVKFLGMELSHGSWTLTEYFRSRWGQLGEVTHWKDLERLIGVLSYLRRTIVDLERLIAPLRQLLAQAKAKKQEEEWWNHARQEVWNVLLRALDRQVLLELPGLRTQKYVLETDWSGEHAGYLLWAKGPEREHLVDLGSKSVPETTSSFLGELKAIVWACQTTKPLRGDFPLHIRTDNQAVAEQLRTNTPSLKDKRVMRLLGWLLGNEDYLVEFVPGAENQGADLLSRPRKNVATTAATQAIRGPTRNQLRQIRKAHKGHFNWQTTLRNLRATGASWPGISQHVRQFVQGCQQCQAYGRPIQRPVWGSWECPRPNDTVFCDFLGPLRWTKEEEGVYVFLMIDGFSRYVSLTEATGPTAEAAKAGLRKWRYHFDAPRRLVSDQGAAFVSTDFDEYCSRHRVELARSPAYAHWSNGMAERAIGTILGRIRREGPGKQWPELISRIEAAYNGSWHSAIGHPPALIMKGERPDGTQLPEDELERIREQARKKTEDQRRKRRARHELSVPTRRNLQIGDEVATWVARPENKLAPQWEPGWLIREVRTPHIIVVQKRDGPEQRSCHAHQLRLLRPWRA